MITFGSVCSGIESASVAWEPLGFRAEWFAEIEKFPSAVLEHHWPAVPNLGDMNLLPEYIAGGFAAAPSVLVGGTPCQPYSLAGRREGVSDPRGGLTLKFVDVLNEIDKKRGGGDECVGVWENVPGVLSSKDNAFGCFLGDLVGNGEPLEPVKKWGLAGLVVGPQRAVAWRVLDAKHFGVPQRRRRVFVVASARNGFDPATVLFESKSLHGDIAPREEAVQDHTGYTASSFGGWVEGCGTLRASGGDLGGGSETLIPTWPAQIASTLNASFGDKQGIENQHINGGAPLFVPGANRAIRRLTPLECERLQGFPDNHTKIPYGKKPCPVGPRYKAIGNSKAVPVVRWIGERLKRELLK